MPYNANELQLPTTEPAPQYLTLTSQKRGVITLIDKSNLPKDAMEEAINIFLYEDGNAGPRPGVGWYGAPMPNGAAIDGIDYYDSGTGLHIIAAAGGNFYRSTDHATTWTLCTGATYITTGIAMNMNQNGSFLYMTNGIDNMVRYNGTVALQTYTTLGTPAAPTLVKTGLAANTYTYYYKVAAVNQVGFTDASPAGTIQVSLARDQWDATANYVTLSHAAVVGAERYDYYISENNVDFYYFASSVGTSTSYKDAGTAPIVLNTTAPDNNTTQGEKYEQLTNVGARQWGVRNKNNRYQIGYTGTDTYSGAFSPSFGGGSFTWQEGGKEIPVFIADYRDGKGTPVATIWCDSGDGQGSIIQVTLDLVSSSSGEQVYLPNAYRLPGSRGTPAPGSVVNVLNDYYFYNSQAIYNIGNRPNLQQILSTDEMSANIRPSVKQISTAGEKNIASAYSDARIYLSVPRGSVQNSVTMVYDTERKGWLPDAFTMGFKKFLKYTSTSSDGTKTQRLLCIKPGDNRLSEISDSIQGDYGIAFETSLKTGLYPTTRNRFDFQYTEEGEIELSNPQGAIGVELLGTERSRGYSSTNTTTIQTQTTNVGWDTFAWDVMNWDDTSVVPKTFSSSSEKKYFRVQKELNNVQWRLTTNTLDARYVTRTLETWGTPTLAGKPRSWRIKTS